MKEFVIIAGRLNSGKTTTAWCVYQRLLPYSDDFKKQSDMAPLVNFPYIDQVYESDQLWPFFASRLPGNAQIDSSSENLGIVELLRKYGQHVITNPYTLHIPQVAM